MADECRSFGADATGFVPGGRRGGVLKPLDRAIADRDHIYGVILGTSITMAADERIHGANPNSRATD